MAQEHIKSMIELFDSLSVAGETVKDEDGVVYLLASLPDSYSVLVTALEANEEVPKLETVIERILHEERKFQEKKPVSYTRENAMTSHGFSKSKPRAKCFHCGKYGHIKKCCRDLKTEKRVTRRKRNDLQHLGMRLRRLHRRTQIVRMKC